MTKVKHSLFLAIVSGLLMHAPSFSLNLKKIGKKIKNQKAELAGGAKVEPLPLGTKGDPSNPKADRDMENFKVTGKGGKTELKVYVKYMGNMEIIHKPGLQVRFRTGSKTYQANYSSMAIYGLVLANPGKTSLPLGSGTTGEGKWESLDKKEYARAYLVLENKLPSAAQARLEILVNGMQKPLIKKYDLPFKIIDYKNSVPEVTALPTKGTGAYGCRDTGDECIDHFKVRELDRDWEIVVRPIKRMCGDAGFDGRRPCLQVDVALDRRVITATHTVGLSKDRKAKAQNKVYQLTDGNSGEGSWKSEDGKTWVKHSLQLGGAKPKTRLEVKLQSYGKPLIKEYDLPFSI